MAKKLNVKAVAGISSEALAKARAEDAEIHRPIREANERGRQWCEVARHAQACREYAHGGYETGDEPHGVLVEQSGYPRDPVVDPEVNLHVSRRWVKEFWGELIRHLAPVVDRAAVASLAAPAGFRPQAKLAFEAVQAQFLRHMDGAKVDAVVDVVCQMRAALGAERSLVGSFFEPLEQLARLRQAEAGEEGNRVARELRERARGKTISENPARTVVARVPAVSIEPPLFEPSLDFSSATWNGETGTFTKKQAVVIGVLYRALQSGTGGSLKEETIAELADPDRGDAFRMRDVFRTRGSMHPWWNRAIKSPSRGVYRLHATARKEPG